MTDKGSESPVLTETVGSVTLLTLNRPRRLNAIDSYMAAELNVALNRVAQDPQCRCLVITGCGRAFCTGQELPTRGDGELPQDLEGLIRDRYVPMIARLRNLRIPVLAAVNGPATGAGWSLALAADLRVASDEAWFSCGFAQIGLVPDAGASYFLPRMLGLSRSLHLALTGERLTAVAAYELGLVSYVFDPGDFRDRFMHFAAELAAGPTVAFGLTKQAFEVSFASTLMEQLEFEASLQQASSQTNDFCEGLQAFRERRPPVFRGR